jgi:Domain of unknown function (DUF4333)
MIPRRRMRQVSAIIVGLCATIALAGCGTPRIDPGIVANLMRRLLESQNGVPVRSVHCPETIHPAKGAVTYCTATLTNGHTVRMLATPTNGSGQVRVAPAEMIADQVQNSIASALAKQRGITATAVCPQHVPIVVGRTFLCRASASDGRSAMILVTIKGGGAFTMNFAK